MTVYGRSASFALFALGAPAPQGSKRHVGRGVLIESSSKVRPWRETVKAAAPVVPRPLDGPLAARVVFTLPRPSSARKPETVPYRIPDLSKLLRGIEDAITEAGLWADDARVAEYVRLAKVCKYSVNPVTVTGV
ncbi:MAG: RusA family crossover junction endodeoxyribonuclease [Actinomycetota bacterium]|nr:RusA family crossover junction endodeoxyribonuclease [Actinomycetota bacterium]